MIDSMEIAKLSKRIEEERPTSVQIKYMILAYLRDGYERDGLITKEELDQLDSQYREQLNDYESRATQLFLMLAKRNDQELLEEYWKVFPPVAYAGEKGDESD